MPLGFEILHDDDAILVVNKPSGVATQAPPGIDSLECRIRAALQPAAESSERIYLGIPHRLDRPASGAMVFAKRLGAARRLSRQFEHRTVRKIYWAAVAGRVAPESGTWTDVLWKVYGQPRARIVDAAHPGGQEAVLHYRTLGEHTQGTWLEIELETGRTHQVRVQAASRGWPLLGDEMYGCAIPFGIQHDDVRLRAIALHARQLEFDHPTSKNRVSFAAPVDEAWQSLGVHAG